jgi:hypothetical protein
VLPQRSQRLDVRRMRTFAPIVTLLIALTGCTATSRVGHSRIVSGSQFGVPLTAEQQHRFIRALTTTPWEDLESDLPRKLAPLRSFQPYFSMFELASTAYSLVLQAPDDTARWRALAKLDSYADGEYSFGYESARRDALLRNPRLFDHCPQFRAWSDGFRGKST